MPITNDPDIASESLTAERVGQALTTVAYPGLTRDIVSFGMVRHVSVCDGRVKVQLALRTSDESATARLEAVIKAALLPIGAAGVVVEIVPPAPATLPNRRSSADPWSDQVRLAHVRHVIAVGAGKGGVGKSTVASELGVPFLGEIPFDATIVDEGDRGRPTMIERADSVTGVAFDSIASAVANALGWHRI